MKKTIFLLLTLAALLACSCCLAEGTANEYIGVSENGAGGTLSVKVTIDGETMTAIDVLEQHETRGLGTNAILKMIQAMLAANSAEVDSVSGATVTSVALKEAVNQALASAGLIEATPAEAAPVTAAP